MTKKISERELALAVLLEIEKGRKSHLVLRDTLEKYQYLDKRERAFITRLVEGTCERRIELDYLIDQVSKTPTSKMKPVIRTILRMTLYQIKYMDQVPASAACNEAVKLAVSKGFASLKGFVNGVARSLSRGLSELKYPDPSDTVKYLSVTYSVPEWIIEKWTVEYGAERAKEILEGIYCERGTVIRVNELKTTISELMKKFEKEGVTVTQHETLPYALVISGYDYLAALPGFAEGEFQVQDVTSMLVAERAGIREGDRILDVCAAPGGKTLHAAVLAGKSGHVEARDLSEAKVDLIRMNISRMGAENVTAVLMDAAEYDEASKEAFDVVIADVPCSGLGVLGKKTDLKYNISPKGTEELVELQAQILHNACAYVKAGGTLMYSTCTISRDENDRQVAKCLANHPEYELVGEEQFFPGLAWDGFYIAKLHRKAL